MDAARSAQNCRYPNRRQLGVGGEQLIKRVLGHADGSVTAIYNRYGYIKEMRGVLEQWATDLIGKPNADIARLPPGVEDEARGGVTDKAAA